MMNDFITLAHGSGGRESQELVKNLMLPAFFNDKLAELHDGAKIAVQGARLAFTTDSYVITPIFFAGGDIGKLAVCGTVNDLAMTGSCPLFLSAAYIIEEGFPTNDLTRIVNSMKAAAETAGVQIVTGDTKVVEKGSVDGIYINTAGIGRIMDDVEISPLKACPGQEIIISGPVGEHAVAIVAHRYGLTLPQNITSDCAPLNGLVEKLLTAVPQVAVLRDLTRGGLAVALNEIASQANVGILLEEELIPVKPEVLAVCNILGFDPLYLANEGKMLLFVEPKYSKRVLGVLNAHPYGKEARIIGKVTKSTAGRVVLHTAIGGTRLLDSLAADQLPRIC
jgi:hydrogenase expression/formation protein HypE